MNNFEKDIEQVKSQVEAIGKAVIKLRKTGLRESILYYLIQRSAKRHLSSYDQNKLSAKMVKAVLDGIETFDAYIFPPEPDND